VRPTFLSLSGDHDPGLRIWEREVDGTWTETYPSGFSEKGIEERERANVSGCRGSIVGPEDEPEHAVFIPERLSRNDGLVSQWTGRRSLACSGSDAGHSLIAWSCDATSASGTKRT
jgi:hypothetical protein